jgi:excisionase family DNA binding protein
MKTIIQSELDFNELIEIIRREIRVTVEEVFKEQSKEDEFLTRKEVLSQLKVSAPTLKKLTNKGTIKVVRFGNSLRYSKNQVEDYLVKLS